MWIYLKDCRSLAESVVSTLRSEDGCNQSPTAKSSHTAKVFSCKECKKGICPKHQYGMILEPSTLRRFRKSTQMISISSTEASRNCAKISALQAVEQAWKESEADYFSRSCAWPKKSSPSSYSLKMSQPSLVEAVFELLEKLPRWGMNVDGVLYPLRPLEPCTEEKGGSCWPTPQARAQTDTPSERKRHTPCLESAVMMWPTPAARDWKDSGMEHSAQNRKSPCLPAAVMMATPTASQASKPIRAPSPSRAHGEHGEDLQDSIGRLNPESIGKRLCPKWTSVLMGYPPGWSSLKRLETP